MYLFFPWISLVNYSKEDLNNVDVEARTYIGCLQEGYKEGPIKFDINFKKKYIKISCEKEWIKIIKKIGKFYKALDFKIENYDDDDLLYCKIYELENDEDSWYHLIGFKFVVVNKSK